MDRDMEFMPEQDVVQQKSFVQKGIGAGLEIEIGDMLKWVAMRKNDVRGRRDRRKIDVEHACRPLPAQVQGPFVCCRVLSDEILQRGVKWQRHASRSPAHPTTSRRRRCRWLSPAARCR